MRHCRIPNTWTPPLEGLTLQFYLYEYGIQRTKGVDYRYAPAGGPSGGATNHRHFGLC